MFYIRSYLRYPGFISRSTSPIKNVPTIPKAETRIFNRVLSLKFVKMLIKATTMVLTRPITKNILYLTKMIPTAPITKHKRAVFLLPKKTAVVFVPSSLSHFSSRIVAKRWIIIPTIPR